MAFYQRFLGSESSYLKIKLESLKEAGLTRVCLSADGFHEAFIPATRVRNAMEAARKVGLEIVLDSRFFSSPEEDNPINGITHKVLKQLGNLKDVELWQGHPLCIGRAADSLLPQSKLLQGIPKGHCHGPWAGGSWEDPAGADVDLYGEVTLCPGISIGCAKKHPLNVIFEKYDPRKYPVIHRLMRGGPGLLAEMA
jgi:hypothetical protein